jgi:hypothetical protein
MEDEVITDEERARVDRRNGDSEGTGSFGDDAADEVVVADGAVGRDVDLADPLVELVHLELLSDGREDVAEVGDGDGAGAVLVEDAEGVAERAVEGLGPEVGAHEAEEAWEVEGRRELLLRGDVPELRLGWVPAEGAHEDAQLRGRDAAVPVRVEQREGLPHRGDLLLCQVLAAHRRRWGRRIGEPEGGRRKGEERRVAVWARATDLGGLVVAGVGGCREQNTPHTLSRLVSSGWARGGLGRCWTRPTKGEPFHFYIFLKSKIFKTRENWIHTLKRTKFEIYIIKRIYFRYIPLKGVSF